MPSRPNPYYSGNFRSPIIANLFRDLAGLIPDQREQSRRESQVLADQARADASYASAGLNRAKMSGQLDKNEAMNTPPNMLAQVFLSGGDVKDDPSTMAPDWRARMDSNAVPEGFNYLTDSLPDYQPITEGGLSAQDKIAQAIQEALMRGVNLTDIAKFAGQGGYLNQVNAGTPEAGMSLLPLFTNTPTTNTALSTTRQDEMSKRDAAEQQDRELAVQGSRNVGNLDVQRLRNQGNLDVADQQGRNQTAVERERQRGRERLAEMRFEVDANGNVKANKPPPTPNISSNEVKNIRDAVQTRATELGFTLSPGARDAIVSEVTIRMQTPDTKTFRNPMTSLDSVVQDLQEGLLAGLELNQQGAPWYNPFGKNTTRVDRVPGASPASSAAAAQPAPARPNQQALRKDPDAISRARTAIAQGADRQAVINRLIDKKIDPSGL